VTEITEEMAARPTYQQIIDLVQSCVRRMQDAGESHRMMAKWISEGLNAAISASLPSIDSKEGTDEPADLMNSPLASRDTEIVRLSAENERLRHVVSDCAAALVTGAFVSPKASIEFMENLPKEISLVVSGLRPALAAMEREGE